MIAEHNRVLVVRERRYEITTIAMNIVNSDCGLIVPFP